ncbi:hypothetical protein K439DRAFT_1616142 [Ramaria rubella]|nr:hypothetical protein K439DRAFT_1616142 [Ramaria rubella]
MTIKHTQTTLEQPQQDDKRTGHKIPNENQKPHQRGLGLMVTGGQDVVMSTEAWEYVNGSSVKLTEQSKRQEWLEVNDQTIGALGMIVDPFLQHELETITEALVAWKKLKDKTQAMGIIVKLESIQAVIRN